MARSEKVSSTADTINELALKRASIANAPFPAIAPGGILVEVEIDKIEPNPDQPRQWIDPDKIEELAASIRGRGTRQPDNPILLRPTPSGSRFFIVSGERRWRAKQLLREQATEADRHHWNTIKALLHDDIDDEKSAFIALEENLQREDLSPVEEGAAYVRLMEKFAVTSTRALAQRIGKPENRIQQMIRLHSSPEFLRTAVIKGTLVPLKDAEENDKPKHTRRRLEFRAAYEFLKLFDHLVAKDPRARESAKLREKIETRVAGWVERALTDQWTVRRVEEQCAALRAGKKETETAPDARPAIDASETRLVLHKARSRDLDEAARRACWHRSLRFWAWILTRSWATTTWWWVPRSVPRRVQLRVPRRVDVKRGGRRCIVRGRGRGRRQRGTSRNAWPRPPLDAVTASVIAHLD